MKELSFSRRHEYYRIEIMEPSFIKCLSWKFTSLEAAWATGAPPNISGEHQFAKSCHRQASQPMYVQKVYALNLEKFWKENNYIKDLGNAYHSDTTILCCFANLSDLFISYLQSLFYTTRIWLYQEIVNFKGGLESKGGIQ